MIRAVIFDLDGTLVETEELKALSYARAANELRPDLDEAEVIEAFKDLVGRSREEVATGLVGRFGLEEAARGRADGTVAEAPWQAFVRVRLGIHERLVADDEVVLAHRYPYNIDLLHDLRRVYPVGLATMSHRVQAWRMLVILGLTDVFEVVATRDDVERPKPDPEIDLLAARYLGVPPEECLVIEDSPAGVAAGLAAGMDVIAVTTALTREKFRNTDLLHRCWVVDDPEDLPGVVKRRIGAHEREKHGGADRAGRAREGGAA